MPANCIVSLCGARPGSRAHAESDLLGGVVTLSAVASKEAAENWETGLYRTDPPKVDETKITAVPYFAWDNREPGEMLVWLRER